MVQPVLEHVGMGRNEMSLANKKNSCLYCLHGRTQVLTEVWPCFSSKVGDTYKLATKKVQTVKGKEGTEMMSLVPQ